MNPLDGILNSRGLDALRQKRETPDAILRANQATNPASAATSEFARYFPGVAQGQPATPVTPDGVSSAKLAGTTTVDIQAEIAIDPERKRLYDAALDFQGIFVGKMLKSMRSNLKPENDMLFGGNRQEIFQDMLYDEYAKAMSRSPGFNLADQMYLQLSAKLPPAAENGARAAQEYSQHSNRISTEQKWSEKDWRP